jgi:hypothetical protein
VDGVQSKFGRQGSLFENAQTFFGIDWTWWLMPTHPELRINYLERTWSKREISRMRQTDTYDLEEENSDPDKK